MGGRNLPQTLTFESRDGSPECYCVRCWAGGSSSKGPRATGDNILGAKCANDHQDAQREIRHTEIALRSLYRFLQRTDPASQRLEMIQVDELRVVLADAMLLFSSFESMLEMLARLGRLRADISWTKYSKQLDDHLGKLERYKSSLSFMLSILQCDSDSEARVNQAKLQDLVEKVLAENTQLRQKLQTSEDAFDARGVATRRLDDDAATARLDHDNATIKGPGIARSATVQSAVNGVRNSIMRFAFENILEGSRVYQRTAHIHECDQSIASSAIGSIFTGHQGRDEGLHDEMADAFETLRVMEETAKSEPSSQPILSSNQATAEELDGDSCQSGYAPWETAVSPPNTLDNTSVETSSTRPAIDRYHSQPTSLDALESALRGGSTNDSNIRSNPLDDHDDEYDGVYPCKGCGEILEQVKAFELGMATPFSTLRQVLS
ncbi:hypothetical protein QBC37DRAFT_386005 [Rhypophila decipiens]|uniref:Fungal N-terminal domain-containing protein n=1 Tax=Rhypophila decipiens TaxID=261697 RepID=A0AAN6YC01_9PEZI|nr:hypothetical protein QBC37DRAFT_386005 [Rhypophila decipiens]